MREIPPVLSVQLYQTVPDVQPSREFLFLGRGRRGDASSGRGERRQDGASRRGEIATRRDPLQGGKLTMLSWA
jgi:hypothetical protein